jgi:TRIAD3 protein (E3 ubiquitin-protein ligase RNF216)
MRRQRFEKAKLENTLLECPCCFDDELLDDDMLACPDGHIFCKECVKRYTETSIGDSKYMFNCINDKCKREFEMSTLSNVLEPNMFSKVLRNIQNEEIKKAGIENLESCKYCTYAAIIENPEEKVFRCLNPDCLKETCRQCNEPNHLPLRCNEIEKSDEVSMRTWIENRVTEAMIRQCHKCSKRFFKVEGCNMMHCVCGASMCYLCRKPTSDYKHFQEGTCKQYSDIEELHQIEMEKAYKEANELYLKDHPDAASIKLKYDPKKILDDLNKEKEKLKKQQQLHMAQIQIGQIANLNNRNVNIIHNGRHYNNVEQLMQHLNQNVNQHLLNVNMHMNIMQQQRANLNQQVNQQLQRANQQIQQANQQIQRARPVLPAAPANNPN